ncbi:o-succinylbenzoate--CoA ligase [Thalassobacillus pellis]|uniref:o-succinylbenzoate--CoA ligase n=1 Tax=Thalassobacillus pellis TaxID=748008 RepID=UPI0019620DD2|nr:o-succinylbenzoate--CoA ligase [Thalassobacillus pellis]MBM7554778.1 O-succinylbenzoic acid--CoA ligase [Thalassobacillus pellis]
MEETIPHWLDKQAEINPHQTAVETDTGASLTFLEIQQMSEAYAKALRAEGIGEGDHVAVLASNRLEMILAIHGLSYLGAVLVLLNTRLTPEELAFQVKDAEVSHFIVEERFRKTAETTIQKARLTQCGLFSLEKVNLDMKSRQPLKREINLKDLFTIIYTSGTTGNPKGVELTYGNHWSSAVGSMLNLGLNENDKWLLCLPMFHVGGFSALMKNVIYGMPIHLVSQFNASYINQAIMNNGVTIISVVTVMVRRLLDDLGNDSYPDSFRCMLLGGGPAPESLLQSAKEKAVPIFQTYGMTETSSQIATLSPKDAFRKLGSAGKALSTAQLKVDAEIGEIGEIKVKGPMVTNGYFNRAGANKEAFSDGWLATGDMGYKDEEGFLYVIDRRKDLIISGGENIYPAEIEEVLAGVSEVLEAGVIGKKDDKWGQVPVAFIVSRTGSEVTKEELLDHCRSKLASYKVPREVIFIDELPRNASNKILRRKLAGIAERGGRE